MSRCPEWGDQDSNLTLLPAHVFPAAVPILTSLNTFPSLTSHYVQEARFGFMQTKTQILTPSLISCTILGKLSYFSESTFPATRICFDSPHTDTESVGFSSPAINSPTLQTPTGCSMIQFNSDTNYLELVTLTNWL